MAAGNGAPLLSMTGFARQSIELPSGVVAMLTLKAVNHRFLDLSVRISPEFEELELPLRTAVKQGVVRGHIDITLHSQRSSAGLARIHLAAAQEYLTALQAMASDANIEFQPDLVQLLRLPGVMGAEVAATTLDAADRAEILSACARAIDALNAMRQVEGEQIAADLRTQLDTIERATAGAREMRESARDAVLQRLKTRMEELTNASADPARLLQEAALLADRSDIAEECARMEAHLVQFRALLNAGGEAGKKLDFLLQEMHREANTMLSKTSGLTGEALKLTTLGLDMKSAIEKCREQVQNLA